jgi:Domain of unknown function (DUF222)
MLSSCREGIEAFFDALDADADRGSDMSFDVLTSPELLRMLERLEKVARRLPAIGHQLINQLAEQAPPEELGGKLSHVLADRLRLTRSEANRRIGEAADLIWGAFCQGGRVKRGAGPSSSAAASC